MLRFINYDIVFQEIPGETTLAINLSNCPNHCKGCHSPYLMEDRGEILDEESLAVLLEKYGQAITCVCFMGGDAAPQEVNYLAAYLKRITNQQLKIGWYSGRPALPKNYSLQYLNYIKLGPYIESMGGLNSPHTNQRFYQIENCKMIDQTCSFQKKSKRDPVHTGIAY